MLKRASRATRHGSVVRGVDGPVPAVRHVPLVRLVRVAPPPRPAEASSDRPVVATLADETLMLRAGSGDRAACEELVGRHLGRIVTFARRVLGNATDAEDAAQEVFLRVWTAAPRWTAGSARFTTWLYRVAMNVCLDRTKKHEATPGDVPDVEDPAAEPSLAVQAGDVATHVAAALAALPETQRTAVTLSVYQDVPHAEAAEIMCLSV